MKPLTFGAATLFLGMAAILAFWAAENQPLQGGEQVISDQEPLTSSQATPVPEGPPYSGSPESLFTQKLAIELLETWGETIHSKRTQAKMLAVQRKIVSRYPSQGEALFRQAVTIAFPDYAEEIFNTLALVVRYEEWLEANHLTLTDLSPLERDGALWQKRRDLFGDDAGVIWADEKQMWARKQKQVQDVIQKLDQARHSSLSESLYQFRTALEETYGAGLGQMGVDNGTIAQVYFGFESVQGRLREMSPGQRQKSVNEVRKQLGYSDEQIDRLEVRDQRREERWANGYSYMEKRQSLEGSLTGPELESALSELREQHFNHEARTIALEEENGFFRYERPRLYGRN
ncbi:hypothetical protein [Marinobacter sp.]|uniref:hypothetical protein n=1 Tax=Marinobacter sp. TaxID=50741 RepID=UPI00384C39EE